MNLLCPNCQNRLSVPEQNAGQLMKCPFCSKYFSVPALPQADAASAGSGIPSPVASQATPGSPSPPSAPSSSVQPAVFALSQEPPSPQTSPPRQEEPLGVRPSPVIQQRPAEQAPPPPPPSGYEHVYTVWLSPRVVSWIVPVALFLGFILMFAPWTGVYPGGYAVYTQNALQMIWGGFSVDSAGEKIVGMEKAIRAAIRANWLMVVYLLLILASLILAAAPLVQARTAYPFPRAFQQLLPWRTLLIVIATLLAFLILLSFLAGGSGFENAVIAIAEQGSDKEPATLTMEERIERGLKLSRLNLSRTFWLDCAVFSHVIALAGAGMELWLQRRGARPLPRIEAHW
jgi:hypothetical protein